MVRTWALLIVVLVVLSTIGLLAVIPVGVSAADVRGAVQTLLAANDGMSQDGAIAQAAEHLEGAQRRRIRFLFLAYMAIWTILGGYMVILARRQARLRDAIARIEADSG